MATSKKKTVKKTAVKKGTIKSKRKKVPKQGKFMKFLKNMFPKKTVYENIFQYIIRQFLMPDSSGRPSLTVTILVFVMAIVAVVCFVEIQLAQTIVTKVSKLGEKTTAPLGFSDNFLYLVIGLSIVITGWYRSRQNKINSNEPGKTPAGVLGAVKQYIQMAAKKVIK